MFAPTIYVEPFNCAAVEAQFCGTPIISTDFGGFTETVEHGVTGFRCSYLGEFVRAIKDAELLDRRYIHLRAVEKYSMHHIKYDYERYFRRLQLPFKDGWNSLD